MVCACPLRKSACGANGFERKACATPSRRGVRSCGGTCAPSPFSPPEARGQLLSRIVSIVVGPASNRARGDYKRGEGDCGVRNGTLALLHPRREILQARRVGSEAGGSPAGAGVPGSRTGAVGVGASGGSGGGSGWAGSRGCVGGSSGCWPGCGGSVFGLR